MLNPESRKPPAAHVKRKIEHAEVRPVVQQLVVPRKSSKRPLRVKVNAHDPEQAVKSERHKPRPERSVKNREAKPRKKTPQNAQRPEQQPVNRAPRRVQEHVRKTNKVVNLGREEKKTSGRIKKKIQTTNRTINPAPQT